MTVINWNVRIILGDYFFWCSVDNRKCMPTNADTKELWQIFHILRIHYLKIFPPCDIQEPFYSGILLFIQTPDGNYSIWGVWDTQGKLAAKWQFKRKKRKFGRNKWIYAQLNVLLWDFLTCLCSGEAQPARWSLTWLCSPSRAHACLHAHRPARTYTFPVLSGRSSGRNSHEKGGPFPISVWISPPRYSAAKANIPSVMEQQFTWAHTFQLI